MSKFSTFRTVKDTTPQGEFIANQLIEYVKSSRIQAEVDAIRSAPDKDTRSELKARLPAVTASGVFSKRSASALVKHSGILIADLDLDENPQLMEPEQLAGARKRLCADKHIYFLFASPSGGLKAGVKIDATDADSHKAAFASVKDWFAQNHGLVIDKACSDVSRLCFLSHDPLACIKANPATIETRKEDKALPIWHVAQKPKTNGNSPGDDFNKRGDVEGLLQSQGWTTRDGKNWTRPGKQGGISGNLGVVGERKFYCWTSSAAPLEANESYSPFALYATFHHGGDFSAAAEALAQEGCGEDSLPEVDAVVNAAIEKLIAKHEDSWRKMENELKDAQAEVETLKKMTVLDYLQTVNIATPEKLAERKKMAREMVFVLPGIAARGQATVIYAPPNSGKTLVTMATLKKQSQSGALGDLTVVYCNFDDDFNSCNLKGEFLAGTGIILIDNQAHTPEDAIKMMEASIKDGSAGSMCFILDTLVRFVSDSDKREQRAFTGLVQRFIGEQGTVIGLGHTNKNKDADGKNVHGGTSDIRNSFSQSAMIEILVDPPEDQPGERQIKIKNDKLRGMAKCSNVYSYAHGDGKNWIERADTVRNVQEKEAQANVEAFLANSQRKQDQPIIDWIVGFLKTGAKPTRDILRANGSDVPASQADRTRVLRAYRGEIWHESRGQNGGTNYYLEDWKQEPKVKTQSWM
jgi:hypothetical protein